MSWSYSYNSDIWPALLTLALIIYLGTYSWRRRNIPAAKPFVLACFWAGLWTIGSILEILATDYSVKVFWIKFQALWHLPSVASITCFVLQYAGKGQWLTRRNYIILFSIPLLGIAVVVTNGFHCLMWTGFKFDGYITVYPGKLYWVFISYGYVLSLINFIVLVRLAISSIGHRLPVAIILSSHIIGRIGYVVNKLHPDLIGRGETTLLVIGLMTVVYALAFLYFHAIDPVAAARKAVLEQMSEGMFVIDLQGRIADLNPKASEILGTRSAGLILKPVAEILPIEEELLQQLENTSDIEINRGEEPRQYSLNMTPLRGRQGELIGKLILLHDITDQKEAQARVLQHKSMAAALRERENLARELHDGIGQILGYMNLQVQTAIKWMHSGNIEKTGSLLGRIVEVAKDAHADLRESIRNLRSGQDQTWDLIPNLKKYINRFENNYGIRTELLIHEGFKESTFDPNTKVQIFRIIQEALTNSSRHSGAQSLKVSFEVLQNKVHIIIADDGHGFDVLQPDYVPGGHYGLVFMQERMDQIGGTLKIDSIPGRGTFLYLSVPIFEQKEKSD
jgi:PAS domain S-box-containing protein